MTAMEALVVAAIIILSIILIVMLAVVSGVKALDWSSNRKYHKMYPNGFDKPSKFGWMWYIPFVLIIVAAIAFAILYVAASLMSV